jgi:integrase
VIERLVASEAMGHRLVREMKREHFKRIVARPAATPGEANDVLKKLKVLLNFAIDSGWRTDNPASRVKTFAEGEFHTWTDGEIARFERRWAIGTTARSAFALLLYTGQCRSDVVRMTQDDVQDGAIHVVQGKTKVKLWIAIHPALGEILAAHGRSNGAILRTAFGEPFTSNGFGNFMTDKIAAAGLPDRCVTHGLRKAAARRLAEAGCPVNEVAAITGHVTLAEVARYTKAAEQKRLARAAIDRLSGGNSVHRLPNSVPKFGNFERNDSNSKGLEEGWRPVGESNPCFQRERLAS